MKIIFCFLLLFGFGKPETICSESSTFVIAGNCSETATFNIDENGCCSSAVFEIEGDGCADSAVFPISP